MTRTPASRRNDYPVFRRLQTRWMDNDQYGHMNNAVHYALFDTAVNGWLIEEGLLAKTGAEAYFLVAETGCRYHSELAFPGWVDAGLRIAHIGETSAVYQIGLFAEGSDTAAADGRFVHVHVVRGTHRPTSIPEAARQVLARLVPAA